MTAARNAELEAAILAAPEEPDAYLVYGDWLLEHGNPLGELVTVQATLAKLRKKAGNAKEKNALQRRENLLLADAENRLGKLGGYEHTWSFGFLESLILPAPTDAQYRDVLDAPAARFLRELDIEDPTLSPLVQHGVSPALRKLALLIDAEERGEFGVLPPGLWPNLASISELTLKLGAIDPGTIVLPKLETLAVDAPLTGALIASLATATWPLLSSVQLDSIVDFGAPVTAQALLPLLRVWVNAGTLRHLGITNHDVGDALVDTLLMTGVVKQLTSLDLSRANMSDRGAATILAQAETFDHLESLNLSENELSHSVTRQLEQRFESVDVEEQGMRGRYDSIEE